MSVTIDCGEGRHQVCPGESDRHYLIPQEDRVFKCACSCHAGVSNETDVKGAE